jgi:uncharacterized protein YdbL (DUF1318 family)
MKLRVLALAVVLSLIAAAPAFALDLHQARRQGLVGEKLDGYATVLKQTSDVQALVADVNAKRQQEYARISRQNGQPVDVVAKLAAQQIITNLAPGSPYQGTDGGWKVR